MDFDSHNVICPRCGSHDVHQVNRTVKERLVYRKRKYCCHNDNHIFFQNDPVPVCQEIGSGEPKVFG